MLVEVRVPVLAESVAEATLMDWQRQPGDMVKFGDALIDVETDKVTLEVVAPKDGMLVSILKNSGEDVESNELIAQIDTEGETAATVTGKTDATEQEVVPEADKTAPAEEPVTESAGETLQQPSVAQKMPKLSPAVRNLLNEHDLDARDIPTGGDRLTKKEVLDYLATVADKEQVTEHRDRSQGDGDSKPADKGESDRIPAVDDTKQEQVDRASVAVSTVQKTGDQRRQEGDESRVPMSRLRRRAAQRLLAAQRENAILTTFNEVNMKPIMDLRSRYKDSFEKTHEVKLGFMSFFTKAAVEALKKFPLINASVDGSEIVYHNYFDIGIAVSSPRGLVVPVIRAADRLSFAEIEKTIAEYGTKARDAKLTLEELIGGTFTITNGGVFGSLLSTPILNPPQSAILGMHKIEERPIAENGEVVIRPMMYLALSYDHRIIDGREAVSFLVAMKELLEDPSRLMLQI